MSNGCQGVNKRQEKSDERNRGEEGGRKGVKNEKYSGMKKSSFKGEKENQKDRKRGEKRDTKVGGK